MRDLHNSQAAASPGRNIVIDETLWDGVEAYIRDIISTFKDDNRILIWDLYNEPANRAILTLGKEAYFDQRLEPMATRLMEKAFDRARDEKPERILRYLQTYERPILCTEWLARHVGSPSLGCSERSDHCGLYGYLELKAW